jgi:hypothetical protein
MVRPLIYREGLGDAESAISLLGDNTMTRRTFRRRPEFESLEAMTLLSGLSLGQHAAALVAHATSSGPIHLSGVLHGTYRLSGDLTAPISFSGSGNVSPAGHVNINGSVQGTSGSLMLKSKHGLIFANLSTQAPGTSTVLAVTYQITGGTKSYANAGGSGSGTITLQLPTGNSSHGKFTIGF